jgi:hypothetical protein
MGWCCASGRETRDVRSELGKTSGCLRVVGGTVGRVCQSQLPNCRVMSSSKAEGSILRRWQNVGSTTTVMKRRQTTGSSAYCANLSAFHRLRSTLLQSLTDPNRYPPKQRAGGRQTSNGGVLPFITTHRFNLLLATRQTVDPY